MVSLLPTVDSAAREVLVFIARSRVATRAALAKVIPDGVSLDRRLRSLLDGRLICTNRSLRGQRSVYQLARRGTSLLGVSVSLARRVGSQALLKHLGVLCLCSESPGERVRIDDGEATQVLGVEAPEGVHVLLPESGQLRMLWCYVPGNSTSIESIVRRLRRHTLIVCRHPTIKQWVDGRRYGLAVIVVSDARRRSIEKAMRRNDRRGHPPIAKLIAAWVYVPEGFAELMGVAAPPPDVRSGPVPKQLWGDAAAQPAPLRAASRRDRTAKASPGRTSSGQQPSGGAA